MTPLDLAKELDRLARELRALTYEAREAVAVELELARRKHALEARTKKFQPRDLSLKMVQAAIGKATSGGANRTVTLRKDVFENRVEKRAPHLATQLATAARNGAPCPKGARVYLSGTNRPAGALYYLDVFPGFIDHTPLSAERAAWMRAGTLAAKQIAPAYYREEAERKGRTLPLPAGRDAYDFAYDVDCTVMQWADDNLILLCDLDAAGKVTAINGCDPAPFAELARQVKAGNPDPLNLLRADLPRRL